MTKRSPVISRLRIDADNDKKVTSYNTVRKVMLTMTFVINSITSLSAL
jgi:hypothetical protein